MTSKTNSTPPGFTAIGIFLFCGAAMAGLAGFTLTWPGTMLDRIWLLNARALKQLAPLGSAIGVLFLLLGLALAIAARGWFLRGRWGWLLAVAIIATQVVGELVNTIRGDWLGGMTGFFIAGGLLFYLLHPRVRAAFGDNSRLTNN